MRIQILAFGSRGDVQPYVALGCGLQTAGHEVGILALDDYETLVTDYGLRFHPLGFRMEQADPAMFRQAAESGRNTVQGVRELVRSMAPMFERMLEAIWAVCTQADALIGSLIGMIPAYHFAEARGLPLVTAVLQPLGRTRHFVSPAFPLTGEYGGAYNRLTHRFVEQLFALPTLPLVNRWRQDYLDLTPLPPLAYPYHHINGQPLAWLYAYSPHVVPPPPDWPESHHVTGYWFLDRPSDWQPPADLLSFLEAGPPPVYVGFGSMVSSAAAAMTTLVVEALQKAGQRGVLMTGWGGVEGAAKAGALGQDHLPETVYSVEAIPHDWLFPRMAAVVHHGGAGTTAAGLRAGVPSIVVPFMGDQPFWARRVCTLGVGPEPIPRSALTADKLAYAIRVAVEHAPMRARAAALGENLQAENGVTAAVQVVEDVLQNKAG